MKVIYLARLREAFGRGEEQLEPPADVRNVADFLAWLRSRGGVFAEELAEGRRFRVAVNHTLAGPESAIKAGDEIAIFPPVTGG